MKKYLVSAYIMVLTAAIAHAAVNPAYQTWLKRKQSGHLPETSKVTVVSEKPESAQSTARRGRRLLAASNVLNLKAATLGASPNFEEEELELTLAPALLDTSYLSDVNNVLLRAPIEGYPSRWDLREHGMTTGAKRQTNSGACWAFSAIASLESTALIYGWNGTPDFSEQHMLDNRLFDLSIFQGGNADMAGAYLLRWNGPVNEDDETFKVQGHVQQVRWIPAKTRQLDNNGIKDAILRFGPLSATISWWNAYVRGAAYYSPLSFGGANHAVAIIGWDDNYSRNNFATTPPGDGAYIVKNSLGSSFGEDGCFYVSYYDSVLGFERMTAFNNLESAVNYKNIYQYDPFGCTASFGGGTTTYSSFGANLFTVGDKDDQIAAVGFYALSPNTSYEITMYKDVSPTANVRGRPTSGSVAIKQKGTCAYAGFWTVPLNEIQPVEAGSVFSIVVKFTTPGCKTPLPIEYDGNRIASGIAASEGQSFFSAKGGSWTDLTSRYAGGNICIKAYGIGSHDEQDAEEFIWENRYLADAEVDGPLTVQAGATGSFTATAIYSDGYRAANDDITTWTASNWTVASGADAVTIEDANKATAKVSVNADITEDTEVVLTATVDDYEIETPIVKSIKFVATASKPSAPVNLTATAGDTDTGVRLEWDAVPNAASYSIFRNDGNSSIYLENVRTTKYTDLEASPGVDFTYTVKAVNGAGSSSASNEASGWRAISAPTELVATKGAYDYVQLTWNKSEGAGAYRVYRGADLVSEVPADLEPVSDWMEETSFRDTPPDKGVDYVYYVSAAKDANGVRESAKSVLDYGSRKAIIRLSNITIEGESRINAGERSVYTATALLSDGNVVADVEDFTWTFDGDVAVSKTYEIVTSPVVSNTVVTIAVTWTRIDEDGSVTKTAEKQIVVVPVVPRVPDAVKVVEATTGGITLSWREVDGASAYRLYRTDKAGNTELLTTTEDRSFCDTLATPGVKYVYKVSAMNAAGESALSEPCTDTMRQFIAPSYVSASSTGKEGVRVTWRSVIGATHYRVSRSDSADGEKHRISDWIAESSFLDATAVAGVTYWYSVESAASAEGLGASADSVSTIGLKSAAQNLAYITIDGPSSIQYDGEGAFVCVATYANGVQKRIQPAWSLKGGSALVSVNGDGIVSAGHVTGENLNLELQATFTDTGVTVTDSFAITIIAYVEQVPSVAVSNVTVRARWPWNGLVDVTYDLYSSPGTTRAVVSISGHDYDLDQEVQAVSLTGDGVNMPAAGGENGVSRTTTWNLGNDFTNFHSTAFSVTVDVSPYEPTAPAGVRASIGTSTNAVELAWQPSFGAVGYEVFRSDTNDRDSAELIGESQGIGYSDGTAEPGETYYYWVRSVAGEWETDISPLTLEAVVGIRGMPPEADPDIESDIVAYYPFNNDFDDWSGNRRDLKINEGVLFADGKAGNAAELDGESVLSIVADEVVDYLEGTFSFVAWVKTGRATALYLESASGISVGASYLQHPFDPGMDGVAGCGIAFGSNAVELFEGSTNAYPCVLRAEGDFGDQWHQVVYTVKDNGAPILYVDGEYVKTGVDTGKTKRLYIGRDIGRGRFGAYAGLVDEVVYYDRALSARDVAELHEKIAPSFTGQERVAAPEIIAEPVEGESSSTLITIGCSTQDAVIYYSIERTDGGDTVWNREWTVPFNLDGNAIITAYAAKEGMLTSARTKVEVRQAWDNEAKEALGENDVVYTTSTPVGWVCDPSVTSDGGLSSMRSGRIPAKGETTLAATFSGSGRLTFDWKVSSEANFDFLRLMVDGVQIEAISGEKDWSEVTLSLAGEGEHVVEWIYSKDEGVDRGSDCAWVDRVAWIITGSQVSNPVIEVSQEPESRISVVKIGSETAGAIYELTWVDDDTGFTTNFMYGGEFAVENDGTLSAIAKVEGLVDSDYVVRKIRRPWLVRVKDALVGDDITNGSVSFTPDYYEYGVDEAYWWDEDKAIVADGGYSSVKSPLLPDAEKGDLGGIGASIFAQFQGEGTMTFKWKVDSESGWDVLTYYAGEEYDDYSYAESISGDRDWADVAITFSTPYNHVLEWEYNKDDSGAHGADASWVDTLKWHPAKFAPDAPAAKTGYEFKGYAVEEGGEVVYAPGAQLAWDDTNTSFIPVWTPIKYTVRYVATCADDQVSFDQEFTYGVAQNLMTQDNFVFDSPIAGWSKTEGATSVSYADGASVKNLSSVNGDVVLLYPVKATCKLTKADESVSYIRFGASTTSSAADGSTYELLEDLTISRFTLGTVMAKNRNVTLDLGGHTLTCTSSSFSGFMFHSSSTGNTMTISNGTFICNNTDAMQISNSNVLNLGSNLTVKSAKSCVLVQGAGATLNTEANLETTGDTFAIAGNGAAQYAGTTINITGGTVKSQNVAVYHPQAGALNISGGEITGTTAVYVKCGQINITGGRLVGNGEAKDYVYYGNGCYATGDALVIDNCGYPGGAPVVNVSGAELISANAKPIGSYSYGDGNLPVVVNLRRITYMDGDEIMDLTPSSYTNSTTSLTLAKPVKDNFVFSGWESSAWEGTKTSIPKNTDYGDLVLIACWTPATCKLTKADGSVSYIRFGASTTSSAADGSTYELLEDLTISRFTLGTVMAKNRNVTLDLGGHTLTCTSSSFSGFMFHSSSTGNTMTISNGTFICNNTDAMQISNSNVLNLGSNLTVKSAKSCVLVQGAGATLNTEANLETTGDTFAIAGNGAAQYAGTTINITGGTVKSQNVAVYHPQAGALNISGGEITGTTAVYVKCGQINITGGRLVGNGEAKDYVYYGNGCYATGDALVIDDCGYPGGSPQLTRTGGELVSVNANEIGYYGSNN